MSDNKKLEEIFGMNETALPSMNIEIKGKKLVEFNEVEDFISLWENHPLEHYREYFKAQRTKGHYMWHPMSQEVTRASIGAQPEGMVFYFAPHKDSY